MEVFRELFLHGDDEHLAATVAEMERFLPAHWSRDEASETRLREIAIDDELMYCFTTHEDGHLPCASLYLASNAAGSLYVSNIVPRTKNQLSIGEYNAVLEDFFTHVVQPAARRTRVKAELKSDQMDLADWLSPAAARKLRSFSRLANKGTGSSHPLDQERWNDFIVTAHGESSKLDASTLSRWLIEVEHWPPEVAHRLVIEYEFGGDLLTYYDGQRRGA